MNENNFRELTHPQKRIWYEDKINEHSVLHNIGGCLQIEDRVSVSILKQAINKLIEQNGSLRIRFVEIDGIPYQYEEPYTIEEIEFMDFSNMEQPEAQYEKWANTIFKQKLELYKQKLYQFSIYKLSARKYGVLFMSHHIICDGWSMALIQNGLIQYYYKLISGEELPDNVQMSPYKLILEEEKKYIQSKRFQKNKAFWNNEFKNLPEDSLYNSWATLKGARKSFTLEKDFSQSIKKIAEKYNCSISVIFIAGILLYLNKTTEKEDFIIGIPVFNRAGKQQKDRIGMFTNTMPFRMQVSSKETVSEFIMAVSKKLKSCLYNQKYPYELLVNDLEINSKGCDSLFEVSMNYYKGNYINKIKGVPISVKQYYCGEQSYSLQIIVKEWDDEKLSLDFDYKIEEYKENTILTMYRSLLNLFNQISEDSMRRISELNLVDKEELNDKINAFNMTQRLYPKEKTIYELFQKQVDQSPGQIAMEDQNDTITYSQLNSKANQLAYFLKKKGVQRGSIVAIMMSHSFELVTSILGSLKAGATYLPIDENYPISRINYMLNDSKSIILLTNNDISDEIEFDGEVIKINQIVLENYSIDNPEILNQNQDIAYIIYTSGSTGKPKGVMVSHQNLVNYISWACKNYLNNFNEKMPLYSSISFDLTITSIFMPLISGNTIIIYPFDDHEFVLYKILEDNKATIVKVTPAHLALLKDMDNTRSSITRFIVGGENLTTDVARKVYESFGGNITIYNEYGPTEATVGCMTYTYDFFKDSGQSVPIGYPADNTQIYILNNQYNIMPDGLPGELYISGDGVTTGYLNCKELTEMKFVSNPFVPKQLMYKTGDLARYLPNGAIEFIGRNDSQVKINGYRIEVGEIEENLLRHKSIKEAIVTFTKTKEETNYLIAYLIVNEEVTEGELKRWLLKFIPRYMIPVHFEIIDKFPLTANGKIDYKSLPTPTIEKEEFEGELTELEKQILSVIEEVTMHAPIHRNDKFYQIGGDSIKAIQIVSKLKEFGLELMVKDILASNTIKDIIDNIKIKSQSNRKEVFSNGEIIKTPIIQWFFSQRLSQPNEYSQYIILEPKGHIELHEIQKIIDVLRQHHDILRLNYDKERDMLYYNDDMWPIESIVNVIDFSMVKEDDIGRKLKELRKTIAKQIDLEHTSLFKVCLIQKEGKEQLLLFMAHHLIVDGVSWRIILNDFFNLLIHKNNMQSIQLPFKTSSYKEWAQALYQRSKEQFDDEQYWKMVANKVPHYFDDFSNLEHTVKDIKKETRVVEELDIPSLIKETYRVYKIEFNELLIIAFVLTIHEISHHNEVLLELEHHGREEISKEIDLSDTVGWFTSLYPAYFEIKTQDFQDGIKDLKEQLRSIPNKGFHYSLLKYLKKSLGIQEYGYIRFNYLGEFDSVIEKFELTQLEYGLVNGDSNVVSENMSIDIAIIKKKLNIYVSYSVKRYEKSTILRLIELYIHKLNEILLNSSTTERVVTPSDFDTVHLSQEELDELFE